MTKLRGLHIHIYGALPCTYAFCYLNGTWTLKTLVLTRQTMNNYALTAKILQQPTNKNMSFEPSLKNRKSWFFFLQWFRGANHQNYCENQRKPRKHHEKTPNTTVNTHKQQKHVQTVSENHFWVVWPMVSLINYDSQVMSQNQELMMETIVETRETVNNH